EGGMKRAKLAGAIAMGALLFGAFLAPSAQAQIYPTPGGYCVLSLSEPLPDTETTMILTVTAADRAGNPIEGIEGTLLITTQPGDSAVITPASFVTGADGTAEVTLFTGNEPGIIHIEGPCDETQVKATVQVGGPPGPPSTGDGSTASEGTASLTALLLGGA